MKIMIIGAGKFIYFLAKTFISKGYRVTIISKDNAECQWLSKRLKAVIVNGDGSDPRILEEAEVKKMDAVLALTPNDEDNLTICQAAEHLFGVSRTITLVNDPEQEKVFRQLGVKRAFSLTTVLSGLIERRVESEDVINLIPIGEGEVNLTEIVLKADSPVIGKRLKDTDLPGDILVTCILRNRKAIIPRGETVLLEQDHLVVMTLPQSYGEAIRRLTGES
ncbi:MAG: potassium transporter TrkA [Desulfobacteraceae bacterium IS3]|nr:MAG: potassium transporter TrkA [Desulfobacteraceae bacterium IS3]